MTFEFNNICRITADCPIIEPNLIDKCIKLYFKKKIDYVSNNLSLSFPDGLDVEVFSLDALIKSQNLSKTNYNKEHVTPFIKRSKNFKKYNYKSNNDYSNRRWTLDNLDDFFFIKKVVRYFYPNIYFSWKDLIKIEKFQRHLINIKKR